MTWREEATRRFQTFAGIRTLDPIRRDYRGKERDHLNEIICLDKVDVRRSDALIVYFDRPSVGTSMETYIAWEAGIPVVVIDKYGGSMSPWMRYHATAIVHEVREAVTWVVKHLHA
jgi:hypothetical protein